MQRSVFWLAAAVNFLMVTSVFAEELTTATTVPATKSYEQRKADLKAACDTCKAGVKKDPGEWDLTAALGFTMAQGNVDSVLLTAEGLAYREIENDIYSLASTER
jgi:hypothetical protein